MALAITRITVRIISERKFGATILIYWGYFPDVDPGKVSGVTCGPRQVFMMVHICFQQRSDACVGVWPACVHKHFVYDKGHQY